MAENIKQMENQSKSLEEAVAGASNPEQLLAFGRKLQELRTQADTAGGVQPTAGFRVPDQEFTLPDISQVVAASRGQGVALDQERDETQRAFDQYTQTQQALLQQQQQSDKKVLSQLFGQEKKADIRQEQQEEFGLSEFFKRKSVLNEETTALQEEYNKEKAAMDAAVNSYRDNKIGAQAGAIDSNIAKIERDYGVRLSRISGDMKAKQAEIAAINGDIGLANQFINDAVDDYTADQKFKVDTLLLARDMNADILDKAGSIYKDAFDFAITREQQIWERDMAERKFKLDQYIASKTGAGVTGVSEGFGGDLDLELEIRAGAADLVEFARTNEDYSLDDVYNEMRRLYGTNLVSDVALRQLVYGSPTDVPIGGTTTSGDFGLTLDELISGTGERIQGPIVGAKELAPSPAAQAAIDTTNDIQNFLFGK